MNITTDNETCQVVVEDKLPSSRANQRPLKITHYLCGTCLHSPASCSCRAASHGVKTQELPTRLWTTEVLVNLGHLKSYFATLQMRRGGTQLSAPSQCWEMLRVQIPSIPFNLNMSARLPFIRISLQKLLILYIHKMWTHVVLINQIFTCHFQKNSNFCRVQLW